MAVWMATEIWHEFGSQAPVTIVPVDGGRLEVSANGETLFDRKAEDGIYPDVKRMRQVQEEIEKLVTAEK